MGKIFLLLLILLTGCAAASPQPATAYPTATSVSPAALRVENGGAVPIERLVLIFPDERREFTAIAPGDVTPWVTFEKGVYRYAAFEGEIAGQTFYQAVMDWIGEQPLEGKAFTYVVSADPNGGPRNLWIETLQVRSE